MPVRQAHWHHKLVRPDVAKRVSKDSAASEAPTVREFLLCAAVRESGRVPASYDVELIHRYRGELAGIGASVKTVNTAHAALRKVFDFVLARGCATRPGTSPRRRPACPGRAAAGKVATIQRG